MGVPVLGSTLAMGVPAADDSGRMQLANPVGLLHQLAMVAAGRSAPPALSIPVMSAVPHAGRDSGSSFYPASLSQPLSSEKKSTSWLAVS